MRYGTSINQRALFGLTLALLLSSAPSAQTPAASAGSRVQTPAQFVGFPIGAAGELVRYPKVLEYFQHLAAQTDR